MSSMTETEVIETVVNPQPDPVFVPNVESLCGDGGFLVLSRKVGQDIVIEVDGITILVRQIDLSPSTSRIGIKATKKATVLRREIWEKGRKGPAR
jgi:carbon storage regulator CsrA